MRVLVVADDPDRGLVLCKGLRDQAFAVDLAADGSPALHKLFVNSYDASGNDNRFSCSQREIRCHRIAGLNAG